VTFAIDPGPIAAALDAAYARLEHRRFAAGLWDRRLDIWTSDPAVQAKIAARLGWLDAVDRMRPRLPRLHALAESVKDAGFTDVVLLGMGGSSLAPDVMRAVIGVAPGLPRFRVLDSVDPDAVRVAMERAATTLFVLASKSGSTIELTCLAAEAERRVAAARGAGHIGSRFIAITDHDSPLHRRAVDHHFRDVFVNPSDIGGRYSALSFFGLVPAALMGIDIEALLASAQAMTDACHSDDPRRNPGLALGAVMGAAALAGRDKLTLALPPRLERFGLWVEQLVAESTGKQGKGIVPIAAEAADAPFGNDRMVVAVEAAGEARASTRGSATTTPAITLRMPSVVALGAEFFRWEVATAAAAWLLDINPFDEPNVQQAKDATAVLLDNYIADRRLRVSEPHAAIEGASLRLSSEARSALASHTAAAFLRLLQPGDYLALLAYLPPDDEHFAEVLQSLRMAATQRTTCAAMLEYGPRYLHSTGQLHKGGPNTGAFILVTATAATDYEVPGATYSFGVLEMAQALGDFESLDRAGRRTLHIHLPKRDPALLGRIGAVLIEALQNSSVS
jgi:glucose-6-phosphate isomerase/transaldolase/glucose-6-phosphate isomerase